MSEVNLKSGHMVVTTEDEQIAKTKILYGIEATFLHDSGGIDCIPVSLNRDFALQDHIISNEWEHVAYDPDVKSFRHSTNGAEVHSATDVVLIVNAGGTISCYAANIEYTSVTVH